MNGRKNIKKPARKGEKDFWESVADDVSTGYGVEKPRPTKKEEVLNEDQEPDDQERADA